MAFFKFRWPGQDVPAEKPAKRPRSPQAESIEVMRRRARHRLMGAAVLVLLGVIGFPLLFDTQPRPIPVDVPIEIPDRNKVAPLVVPAQSNEPDAVKAAGSQPANSLQQRPSVERVAASATLTDGEELIASPASGRAGVKSGVASAPVAAVKSAEAKNSPAIVAKPMPRAEDAVRGKPATDARQPAAAERSDDERFIVQVGAFADADKAKEVRLKLERAGLKTYTQVVDSKDGKRTRVRVGPYGTRADADKAAARIKGLDLSASVLTL